MKIPSLPVDAQGLAATATASNARSGAAAAPGSGTAAAAPADAAVSSRILDLRAKVAAGDVVDHAKVAAVAKAIADGSFEVNSNAVADRMLQAAADMLEKSL